MPDSQSATTESGPDVLVYNGNEECTRQPETFHCCPLGVEIYTACRVPDFKILELKFNVYDAQGAVTHIECSGTVVHGELDSSKNLHRHWVTFLDLPESTRESLLHICNDRKHKCPYCENY